MKNLNQTHLSGEPSREDTKIDNATVQPLPETGRKVQASSDRTIPVPRASGPPTPVFSDDQDYPDLVDDRETPPETDSGGSEADCDEDLL